MVCSCRMVPYDAQRRFNVWTIDAALLDSCDGPALQEEVNL